MAEHDPSFAENVERFKEGVYQVLMSAGPGVNRAATGAEQYADELMDLCSHVKLAQTLDGRELVVWQDDQWQVLMMEVGLTPSKRLKRLDPPRVDFEDPLAGG